MPQTHSTASATGLTPVPVAVLLPPPAAQRHGDSTAGDLSAWYGVAPRDAACLIARYSQPGDLVIELDGHPTVTRAARHLGRRPAAVPTDGDGLALSTSGSVRLPGRGHGAGLILGALPRPGLDQRDLPATSAAMQTWRAWLRSGGYLLTAVTPPGPDAGTQHRPVSYRATVIAAAKTAGFTWQQELLVLTAQPPECEPRALPDAAVDMPLALIEGRHQLIHIKVLAFRHEAGGHDA